ncbi:MAG: hypothetical protein ABL901_20050 [Hyphomicrobiaceae bacterium]
MMKLRPAPDCAPRLHPIPCFNVDQSQLWHVLTEPFGFRVLTGHALARGRVFDKPLPVIDDCSPVQLVVEDAVATLRISQQRRCIPPAATRSGDALTIEVAHDSERPFALCVLEENPANDFSFAIIDGAPTSFLARVLDDIVAVALAAGDAASLDATDLTAPGFLRKVLQKQRRHRALQADMDFGHRAVGKGLDPRAVKGQCLVKRCNVGLAPREAVEAFCDDDVELCAR